MMRNTTLVVFGAALALTVAACSDTTDAVLQKPAPIPDDERRQAIDAVDPPKNVEKGVVPNVINVQAKQAVDVVKEAGFNPDPNPLALVFEKPRLSPNDVICETDPEAGATPPKKSEVRLVYDIGC